MATTHKLYINFDPLDTAAITLSNPTFDTNITGWTETDVGAASLTPTHETTIVRSGAGSLKLVQTAAGEDDHMSVTFPCVAGVTYQVSAWANVTVFTFGSTGLRAFGPAGTPNSFTTITTTTSGWVRHEVTLTPAASGNVTVRLYSPQGTCYWDDVEVVTRGTDLSSRLLEVPSVRVGVDGDLDDPQPGSATFRLDNRDRALEPGYAASGYHPNVRPLRRVRYLINDGTTDWPQFHGYILSWGPTWPGGMNQEAIIQAVDGSVILEMDRLPALDPPEATTYADVLLHDEPWGMWGLTDPAGSTTVSAQAGQEGVPLARFKKRKPPGQSGTVKTRSLLTLGQPGLVLGESSTSGFFEQVGLNSGHVRIPLEEIETLSDSNTVSVSALVKPDNGGFVVTGPHSSGQPIWILHIDSFPSPVVGFSVLGPAVTYQNVTMGVSPSVDGIYYVAGGFSNGNIFVALEDSREEGHTGFHVLQVPAATEYLRIGREEYNDLGFDGWIQYVAVYEAWLEAGRTTAQHQACRERGLDAELAGDRVASVAVSGLWAETDIAAGTHQVAPVMWYGQSRLEVIKDAVKAEFPSSLFYFQGDGDPRYLGWDYGDTSPFNTVQVTMGNHGGGEVPFESIDTTDEDELYNIVTVSREGGLAQTATDEDSVAEFYRRVYDLTGLIHTDDMGCATVAAAILSDHSQPDPPVRVRSVTLTSDNALALAEILERMPGDLIRVKHRPKGGTAIDIITRIRGRTLTVAPLDGGNRVISATWTAGRGFNAAVAEWRLGVVGYSELQTATVLGLMAWTTATTRASGYLVTAAVWNSEHVDNMNWLKEVSATTFTATVAITATTDATANTVVTAPAHTFEAVPYLIEFMAIAETGNTAGALLIFNLYDGATEAGRLGTFTTPAAAIMRTPVHIVRRITPTAAAHTYGIRAWRAGSNGNVVAGAGTAGTDPAGFLRITRVPV